MSFITQNRDLIYYVFLFACFAIGVIQYKKLTNPLKVVFLFVGIGCLTEITIDIWKKFWMSNTMPIGNIYIPVSFLILGLFYLFLLKNYLNRKIIIGIIIAFELLCILNYVFIQNLLEFPNITASIGALIIIAFSVIMFSKIMSEAKIEKLSKEPIIWINTAFLIYYSTNFSYFILFNMNVEYSREFAIQVSIFYVAINCLLYLLISIGFLNVRKR